MSIDIKQEVGSVQTVEEFDAVLTIFKKKNPAKFALKEANGEFLKFRRTLIGYNPDTDPEVIAQREAEAKAEAEKEKAEAEAETETEVKAKKAKK